MKRKLSLCFVVSLLVITLVFTIMSTPSMRLKGNDTIYIEVFDEYEDPGVEVKRMNKDLTDMVMVDNQVNNRIVGSYDIEYTLPMKFLSKKKVRKVIVQDTIAPELKLKGNAFMEVCPVENYMESGFTAVDNYDGDITDKVEVKKDGNYIFYHVEDSNGNASEKLRVVQTSDEAPLLRLSGEDTILLKKGNRYTEYGYVSLDKCDGNLTKKVTVTGNVDTSNEGEYVLKYSVTDTSNLVSEVFRKVIVQENPSFKKKIYLTFDDGPSNVTENILDILKENDIKATFFVIGTAQEYDHVIQRAFNEGHTIALHSNTHIYKKIYANDEAYFEDLAALQQKIKNLIGVESTIMRFPGGSSNTTSRVNKGIMTRLALSVSKRGYFYYDWNIDSTDAMLPGTNTIIRKVTSGLKPDQENIVLLHDFGGNKATVNALQAIIDYANKEGYVFDKITEDTPQIFHQIVN